MIVWADRVKHDEVLHKAKKERNIIHRPSGVLAKAQGSFNLVQDLGHKESVLRPRCIGPGRARTHIIYSILFHSIPFYSILFYSILFYSILFYSILFHSIPFHSILFYSIPFHSIPFYSILFYILHTKRRKADWIGHILRRNFLLKRII